jgi:hypothetical protein
MWKEKKDYGETDGNYACQLMEETGYCPHCKALQTAWPDENNTRYLTAGVKRYKKR